MTDPGRAVFLSYASQDAEAAQKICEALRISGIEVWFDQSELRGGDVWDQSIRKQIKSCALFLPVISHTTHDRREGYFRLEWKLAVDRCHLMDANLAFLLPVAIDDTRDDDERVPERFREVQWTRLPGGDTPPAFVERVKRLLSPELSQEPTGTAPATARVAAAPTTPKPVPASWRSKPALLATIAVVVLALGYLAANRLVLSKHGAEVGAVPGSAAQSAAATAFNPPPHSIAVLPFLNMSGDANQEYFSDGVSEELLDALSRLKELQVVARTSSFSFKHQDLDASAIARKLNVGAVLEGSVRRSGRNVRIAVQLINGKTGFQIWGQTYDRVLDDALKLQSEVASTVAEHLKVKLTGEDSAKLALGGTGNAAAYDAYLFGLQRYEEAYASSDYAAALAAFDRAIALDPDFALAYARRAATLAYIYRSTDAGTRPQLKAQARAAAEHALALAPQLGEAHLVLAYTYYRGEPDLAAAAREYDQALALAPGSAWVQRGFAWFASFLGHFDVALRAARRAVTLDARNGRTHEVLAEVLISARRYREALGVLDDAIALLPGNHGIESHRPGALIASGQIERARATCESPAEAMDEDDRHGCLAMVYHRLGRQSEAAREMEKFKTIVGDGEPYAAAGLYAQLGNKEEALRWLAEAEQRHDLDLLSMKVDWYLDPIRNEPQFKAIEARMKFPP